MVSFARRRLSKRVPTGSALAASLLCGALGLGCDDGVGVGVPLIQTEELVYALTPRGNALEAEIRYTFENRTGGPVYLVNCGGSFDIALDRLDGGQWIPAWGSIIPSCLSPEIRIGRGEVFADTLSVRGAPPGSNAYPQFASPDPSGTYRIRWVVAYATVQDGLGVGPPVPEEYRVSNSFELTTP